MSRKPLALSIAAAVLIANFAHAVISCEDEFSRRECKNGVVTFIDVDQSTAYEEDHDPTISGSQNNIYDTLTEANCCSPNRTRTLSRSEKEITVGSIDFELDATSLFAAAIPAGYALDGATLKFGGSHTITVEAAISDEIAIPRCSEVDVMWGASHQTTVTIYEGDKTCKYPKSVYYPEPAPHTVIEFFLCGTFHDICQESVKVLHSESFLEYSVPVSPTPDACPGVTPNPCADPQNHTCVE